ncbi:response regulator [Caballeronia sp. ATUFL_M2_KS44]|uniref:response regulator n=1 Tax=Caballeronia sp. ATUFL_M2_KS44 TaxID=2921767 RepID=UPI0020294DAF|nr:response regulator [Caballeronia sp. ATUFL_M2_KS44]
MNRHASPVMGAIAICAPSGIDADTIAQAINAIDLETSILASLDELGARLSTEDGEEFAGLFVTEEALVDELALAGALRQQPVWSDLPVIILTVAGNRTSSRKRWALFKSLGNVTLLARPLRREDLESAARGIVRARARQHETRAHLLELKLAARDLEARVQERTAALMEVEAALRQSQKMEAIGQLTGGLAHDFNNLLQIVSSNTELIKLRIRQGNVTDLGRYAHNVSGATEKAAALTHRLLAFSRQQTLDPKPVDVNRLVLEISDLVKSTVGPAIKVETRLHADPMLTHCDPPQLENALLNLCINARDAMPNGGQLHIDTDHATLDEQRARRFGLAPGDYVSVAVTDNGDGMTPEVAERAFDPFFTTKPMGKGTGVGLSMVYGFTRQSQGHASIDTAPGKGTTVRLWLPELRPERAATQDAASPRTAIALPATLTVLLVDDETGVRTLLAEILRDAGYEVIEANDGVEGLEVLQSEATIDIVVTDVGMPRMNGVEMIERARVSLPELKVLFITGYAQQQVSLEQQLDRNSHMLTKPFAMNALLERVAVVVKSSSGPSPN